jgi:hypothetical protein
MNKKGIFLLLITPHLYPSLPKRGNTPLNPLLIEGKSSLWKREAKRDFINMSLQL